MVGDGARDLLALAARRGVVRAHDALHARELHDGARHEIRFREVRGALCVGRIGRGEPRIGREVPRERRDALGLRAHRAERLLEHHLVQTLHVGLERTLEVLLVEELRVGQARADNALVAVHDG